ncbi:hypothetical protein CYMTET_6803 [Cymbomonas tetramitiformis]|uniref:General transcription factor TFIIB n=1 Tax=Cymbomonas tetramitiformis TaxID=36881 RepID=A0AAE0LHI8_9CHLO|nr:hypothetical protein CYMTET_6803 [Cymbomonas tetramitiformis]
MQSMACADKSCGGSSFKDDYASGDLICTGCGLVVAEHVSFGCSWDESTHLAGEISTAGCIIQGKGSYASQLAKLNESLVDSAEATKVEWERLIDLTLGNVLEIPDVWRETMKDLLSVLRKHHGTTGRARKATIAALLFAACHKHGGQGWSLKDCCNLLGAKDAAARNAALTLKNVLFGTDATSQVFLPSGYIKVKSIVVNVCDELSLRLDVTNTAVKASQLIREDAILDGKKDVTVATTAVFCAMKALQLRPSLTVIAEKAGISKEALSRALRTVMAKEQLWTQLLALASSSAAGDGAAFQSAASSRSLESSAEACFPSQGQRVTPVWQPRVEQRRRALVESRLSTA